MVSGGERSRPCQQRVRIRAITRSWPASTRDSCDGSTAKRFRRNGFGDNLQDRSTASARSCGSGPRSSRASNPPRSSIAPVRSSAARSFDRLPISTGWTSFLSWSRNRPRSRLIAPDRNRSTRPGPGQDSAFAPRSRVAPPCRGDLPGIVEVGGATAPRTRIGTRIRRRFGTAAATPNRPGSRRPASRSLVAVGDGAAEPVPATGEPAGLERAGGSRAGWPLAAPGS